MTTWNELQQISEIDSWITKSKEKPVLLFKHSNTCGISHAILHRLQNDFEQLQAQFDMVIIDLLKHRDVSNAIASKTNVMHQSPQVIVIDNGKVVHHSSHHAIRTDSILSSIEK